MPRNVTFLGFVYVGFYADLKGDDLFVRFKLGRLTVFDAADGIQHLIVVLLRLGVVVPGVLVLEDHMGDGTALLMLAEGDLQVRILVDKAQIDLDDVTHKVTGALVLIVAVEEIPQVVDGQHDLVRVGGDIREGRGVLPLDDDIHPAGQQLKEADGIVGRQLDDAVIGIKGEHFAQADEVRLQLVAEAVGQSAVLVLHAAEPVEDLVVGLALLIGHFLVPNEDDPLHEADVDVLHGAVDIGLRHLQKFRQLRDIDLVGPQVLVPLHDLGDRQTDQLGFHQRQIGLLAPQQLVGLHDIEVLAVTDGNAVFPGQIVLRCLLDQRIIVTLLSACIYIRNLDLFSSMFFSSARLSANLFIKVNGKTSGFEPGDESEHLIPPYTQNCVFVICTWSTVVI